MPELPEVETIRRQLAPLLAERTIVDAAADANPKFTAAPAAIGGTVTGVDRRGKYLLVGLDHADGPRELVVHLGMTGQLGADIDPGGPHVRAWWGFADGGTLGYRDVRQFGRIAVVPAGRYETLGTLGRIGPEPLSDSFTPAGLWEGLHRRRARVKTVLLGQQVVVLGRAETQTAMSQFNMFKIYKGGDNLWVEFPEMDTMPPQAEKIRVEGIVKKKKFSGIPEEQLYIEAKSVTLE